MQRGLCPCASSTQEDREPSYFHGLSPKPLMHACRYNLTSFQSGLVVSSSLGGALVGSMGAFLFGDKLGRRKELLLASSLYGALRVY